MSARPALAIGAVAGGPGSDEGWSAAVKRLGRRVIELRGDIASPLAVNVVFQIPGQYLQPDFTGVRSGRFSRGEGRLLIQVALPPRPSRNAEAEALNFLNESLELAEEFARQEGIIDGKLVELRELLDRIGKDPHPSVS